jgi:hypothetical protein
LVCAIVLRAVKIAQRERLCEARNLSMEEFSEWAMDRLARLLSSSPLQCGPAIIDVVAGPNLQHAGPALPRARFQANGVTPDKRSLPLH